ncbi:alpha/beta hydrolase [Pseudonocardia alni]|uniref:alpha/beta hydrolase n=1 Tax=Pseudonocardia alni TaxID=33907 RepID=UPI0033324F56
MNAPAPEAAALLARLDDLGMRPYTEIGVFGARHAVEASRWMQGAKPGGVSTHEVLADGGDGPLPVRVYHPEPGTELPLTVWLHGGGWVTGSVALADRPCRAIAAASRTVVASVEYRRAPETPFPGPLDDAVAATRWLATHAHTLGADGSRVAVGGDSAGATLATAAARRLRGARWLRRQVLVYPPLTPPDPDAHPSWKQFGAGHLLTREDMTWFWHHYLGCDPHAAIPPPDAAPLTAPGHAGVAPVSIAVAGCDPLRDEGVAYAVRLGETRVPVSLREWPDMIHGFLGMGGELAATAELVAWIADELSREET